MSLPERIHAIKNITYYVPEIVESLKEMGEKDIDIDVVLGYIHDWVEEDLGGTYGVVYQDENGSEL
jgi:hypothetical protein